MASMPHRQPIPEPLHTPAATPPSAAGHPHVLIQLTSDPCYLEAARCMIEAIARRIGFSPIHALELTVAVDEALANVIRHGYASRPDLPIWVAMWPLPPDARGRPGIRLVIEDEAPKVDPAPLNAKPTIEQVDQAACVHGGRGIPLIRACVDELLFEQRDTVGMRLTLVKRLPDSPAPTHTRTHPDPRSPERLV